MNQFEEALTLVLEAVPDKERLADKKLLIKAHNAEIVAILEGLKAEATHFNSWSGSDEHCVDVAVLNEAIKKHGG